MIQLGILSGKMAGTEHPARHFPFYIGRSPASDLRVEEAGIWDEHVSLSFDPAAGIVMRTQGEALASVNGKPCREMVLRNGDELDIGALKIRFWLGATRQKSQQLREWLTWAAFVAIAAAQLFLIYRLIP